MSNGNKYKGLQIFTKLCRITCQLVRRVNSQSPHSSRHSYRTRQELMLKQCTLQETQQCEKIKKKTCQLIKAVGRTYSQRQEMKCCSFSEVDSQTPEQHRGVCGMTDGESLVCMLLGNKKHEEDSKSSSQTSLNEMPKTHWAA